MTSGQPVGGVDEPNASNSAGKAAGKEVSKEDCARALQRMYEFLDDELATADVEAIREHLEACEPCLDTYDLEQMVKTLIRRSCGGDIAPAALRTRVMVSMTTVWRQTP
jgi:anti-sigma factor (TIGR02949 family)